MSRSHVFSSTSVTSGHSDKLCDQLSDAVLDRVLRQDPLGSARIECAVSTGIVFVDTELDAEAEVDISHTVRQVLRSVGYGEDGPGFSADECSVLTRVSGLIDEKRADRDERELDEAGLDAMLPSDQISVIGYACDHTPTLMPLPIDLAHRLTRRYEQLRVDGEIGYLAPDGKARVAVAFEDRRPARLRSVVFHATHLTRNVPPAARVESDMMEHLIRPTLGDSPIGIDDQTSIAVNPGGPVARGGPAVHSGMTGRKVTDDKYGGYVRTGRAAMCGKGPTSLERTGVYAARHVAKNVVAAGLARECEVSLTYDHDHPAPLSIDIDTFDSAKIGEAEIESRIADAFDLRVGAIIAKLNLRHLPTEHSSGFYRKLAAHGQVGREDLPLPWERTDKAEALRG